MKTKINPTLQFKDSTQGSLLCLALALVLLPGPARAAVRVERVPDSGLQPQVVAGADGGVHLVYLTGDPKASDVQYRFRRPGAKEWLGAMRVNSQPGSAVAAGTIRGAQFDLGRGIVHVCWNGSQAAQSHAEPGHREPGQDRAAHGSSPMLYARMTDDRKGFTPQRNVMTATHQLDGGGSIAADAAGRVFVMWHASPLGSQGESTRAVYAALSIDDGKTFAPERAISPAGTGACGCCGLSAFSNPAGEIFVLYRIARTAMQRDMMLLASRDHGDSFSEVLSHPWNVGACPMSSASFAATENLVWASWETEGQIHAARLTKGSELPPKILDIEAPKGAKHPRVAINRRGETLVVWTVGTGWQRGGSLAWQVYDAEGKPAAEHGQQEGVPVWSFATAFARANGDFVILY